MSRFSATRKRHQQVKHGSLIFDRFGLLKLIKQVLKPLLLLLQRTTLGFRFGLNYKVRSNEAYSS